MNLYYATASRLFSSLSDSLQHPVNAFQKGHKWKSEELEVWLTDAKTWVKSVWEKIETISEGSDKRVTLETNFIILARIASQLVQYLVKFGEDSETGKFRYVLNLTQDAAYKVHEDKVAADFWELGKYTVEPEDPVRDEIAKNGFSYGPVEILVQAYYDMADKISHRLQSGPNSDSLWGLGGIIQDVIGRTDEATPLSPPDHVRVSNSSALEKWLDGAKIWVAAAKKRIYQIPEGKDVEDIPSIFDPELKYSAREALGHLTQIANKIVKYLILDDYYTGKYTERTVDLDRYQGSNQH